MRSNAIHKILVIRFSSIGDIILTTPVIRCLKKQYPGAEIHFLIKEQYLPVIRENPYITKIRTYSENFDILIPELRNERFDFIVDLHRSHRSRIVRFRLHRPGKTFRKLNILKWILVNLKIDLLPDIHIVDRYFKAVQPLGVQNDGEGLDYFIPATEEVPLSGLPAGFRDGFIAASIGGRHVTKILPVEQLEKIFRQVRLPVILLGGKEDKERGKMLEDLFPGRVLNACGKYTISQSASIVRQSACVLTNDTGLMHIAAAFRKPVASAWGNTVPKFGMYPYIPGREKELSAIFEVNGLSCRPCSKLGFNKCPKGHFRCMLSQDTDAIARFLNSRSGI